MIHPTRSSSLHGRSSADPPYAQPSTTGQVVFENGQYTDRPQPNQESALPQAKNGLQDLAGTRAQLVVVQRRLLEQVGRSLEWSIGWAAVLPVLGDSEELEEVSLDEEEKSAAEANGSEQKSVAELATPTSGISASALLNATTSIDQFRQFYEVGEH